MILRHHWPTQDYDDDNETIIGGGGPLEGAGGPPNDGGEGMDDGKAEVMMTTMTMCMVIQLAEPRGPRDGHGPRGLQGPMRSMTPIFMNVYNKCPIFSAENDEY